MTIEISASQMLSARGWLHDAKISIDAEGYVVDIGPNDGPCDHSVGVLLPAMGNVHSHSFQRAMAGLAERCGPTAIDDFWTWRQVMYRFLELLSPDDIEVIAAQVQMEMMEAGYAAQAEFHYLHHAPGGKIYDQLDETSLRHFKAAELTGIGYTHLPVLYMQGGLDGRPLEGGQTRFGCDLQQFSDLYESLAARLGGMPDDFKLGVAPHSLRAVSSEGMELALSLSPNGPIHIHAAEQIGEVREVVEILGSRPVRWLLDHMPVDARWCLIHATQMEPEETLALARSGAVAGICPITEANLGDGMVRIRMSGLVSPRSFGCSRSRRGFGMVSDRFSQMTRHCRMDGICTNAPREDRRAPSGGMRGGLKSAPWQILSRSTSIHLSWVPCGRTQSLTHGFLRARMTLLLMSGRRGGIWSGTGLM